MHATVVVWHLMIWNANRTHRLQASLCERPLLLLLSTLLVVCIRFNRFCLTAMGSRARQLELREFCFSNQSLSGIVLFFQSGQLPHGPATSETAA